MDDLAHGEAHPQLIVAVFGRALADGRFDGKGSRARCFRLEHLTEPSKENQNPGQLLHLCLFWRWPRGGFRRRTLDQIFAVYSQEVVEHDALGAPEESKKRGVEACRDAIGTDHE